VGARGERELQTMASYELRRGRRADARIVRKILVAALREHGLRAVAGLADVNIDAFGDDEASKDQFVAVFGGKVIGFVIVAPIDARSAELSHVFVDRAHRRRGAGSLLLARAIDASRERGYDTLHLSTMNAFRGAAGYYERHGWTREGEGDHDRDRDDGSMFFMRRLRPVPEAPRIAAPIPRTLHAILSLLDRFTRLRDRLARDVATPPSAGGASPRADRHSRSS
jgi:GNAT superfamily N-acetyltransferase